MKSNTLFACILLTGIAMNAASAQAESERGSALAPLASAQAGEGAGAAGGATASEAASPSAAGQTADTTGDAAATGSDPAESGAYIVRLKGLEQRVNELKERIFRSKARLNLLKETVLHGVIAGSRSVIRHKNEMGSAFRLVKLIYALDGTQIYSKAADDGALDEQREFDVFNGKIVPGNHTVTVLMVYQGHGYGIFTYLKGYKFTVRASHTFTAAEGRQNLITVRAYEKGNATTELEDRPAIEFESSLYKVAASAQGEGQ